MTTERFLLDSNSFITPYRQYYAFDLVPSYWRELSEPAFSGRLVLLDMVKAEIDKGNDALAEWLDEQTGFAVCNHVTPEIIGQYQKVLQYLQNCGLYLSSALESWAPANVADPWLIAAAKVNDYTIITAETYSGGLSVKNPNKRAKIPDVAKAFDVKVGNVFYMMRKLGIRC